VRGLALICVLLFAAPAYADDAAAKTLFDQGKTLFAEGKYGEACAKLEASFKLSAVSSTRGLLGACYEKVGKLASAWAAYRDSAAIAERQGHAERAQAAREKAAELEPKLARVTVDATAIAKTSGVKVTLDGVEQPIGALGIELPIDAGPHELAASAQGYKPWRTTIDIQDGERQTIKTEALVADPTQRLAIEQQVEDERRIARRRKQIAFGLVGGGGLAVGVGVTLGLLARSQWQDAKAAGCTDDGTCPTPAGKDAVDGAAVKADIATYVSGAGLLLVGAGVLVYVTSPKPRNETELRLTPTASPGAAGLVLQGRF
jgi:tetratricopeptide (TPR) repeat protein